MILSSFIISIINILAAHTLLTRKKPIIFCLVAFIINTLFVFGVGFLVLHYVSDPIILKYILYSAASMYIVYAFIIFKESIAKKIFTMFSIWLFCGIVLFMSSLTFQLFNSIFNVKYVSARVNILRIFLMILLLVVAYFWLNKPYKKVLNVVSDNTSYLMSLYPIISFLLVINNPAFSYAHIDRFKSTYDILLYLLSTILGYLLVFAGVSSSSRMISLQYNYKIIEQQVELQRQNYKTLNESLQQLYALKHDVRHHFSAMKAMLQQQNYKEAFEYIEQFNQNDLSQAIPTLCQNFTADSIIKYYMSLAISKNIDFEPKLNIPEYIGINPLDLCIVLGNSLENAIDACDKLSASTKKRIELMSDIVGAHIVIKIVNNFNGNIVKIDNIIKTSKDDDGSSHGIGLSSIRETVKKYNGNLDIQYSDDKFEVTIIMSISCMPTHAIS